MKKAAFTLAVLVSLLAAVSCSEKNNSDSKPADINTITTAAEKETVTEAGKKAAGEETAAMEAENKSETDIPAKADAAAGTDLSMIMDPTEGTDFEKGTIDGTVYTSEYGGFRLALPKDYVFFSDEELINSSFERNMPVGTVCDAAANSNKASLINVYFDNINLTLPEKKNSPEKEYIQEYFDKCVEYRKMSSENAHRKDNYTANDNGTVTLGGQDFWWFDMKANGALLDNYYCRKINDDYYVFIASEHNPVGMQKYVQAIE